MTLIIKSYKTGAEQEISEKQWEILKEKGLHTRFKLLDKIPESKLIAKKLEPLPPLKKQPEKMPAGTQGKTGKQKE